MHTGDDLTTQNSKRAGKKTSQPAAVRGADSGVNPEFVQRIDWLPTLVAGQTRSPAGERLVWLSVRVVSERPLGKVEDAPPARRLRAQTSRKK